MYPNSLPFALPLLPVAILTAGLAIHAFRRPKHAGAITFGWLMTGMALWSALNILEYIAPSLSEKILSAKLEYIGFAAVPPLWLALALEYTGHAAWLTRRRRLALITFSTLTFVLALSNEYHHLIWREVGLEPNGFPSLLVTSHGLWFWIFTTISYALIVVGIAMYLTAFARTHHIFRQQISVMVVGALIPLAGNIIFLFAPMNGIDPTPYTFALSGIFLAIGLFRFNLINLVPIAAALVIENLSDAIIVLDAYQRVVDLNSAARSWLNINDSVIGRSAPKELAALKPVWDKWATGEKQILIKTEENSQYRWFDISISPLQNLNKNLLGHVLIARDKTDEQELLAMQRHHTRQMELINSITIASLETSSLHEMTQTLADHLGELLEADGAFITLWDDAEKKPIPGAAYGELREMYPKVNFTAGETSITGSVLQAGHAIAVEDVFNTPFMSSNIAARFPSRSMLALPLISHGQKLGAALIAFNQPHIFSEHEIALGEQAAAQIAVALNKIQLLDSISHRVIQLSLLNEVSRQITESLDEKDICERTVHAIMNVFGYDEATISLLVGNELELIAIGGTVDMGLTPGFRQNVGQGIVGHVAATRQHYFTSDIIRDPYYYHPDNIGTGSALGVPILYEGQLLGVIYTQSAPPNLIFPEDVATMQTLSSHLSIALQKSHVYANACDSLISMTALQSITETVTSSLDLNDILKTVVQLLKETYGYAYVSIYLAENSTLQLGAQAGYTEELIIHEIPVHSGIVGRTARTRQTQFIRNVHTDPNFLMASREVQSEICVPLLKNDKVLGVINIESASNRPLTEKDMSLLVSFAGPLAMAIDNARLHAQATSLALTDGMTGLFNRRAFDQYLETELIRAERYGHPLSLIIIDMDSFKEYNDTYGHPAGDERLKAVANILSENVREPDAAIRYGGEEFAIILPHTPKEGAILLAERLRETTEAQAPEKPHNHTPIPGYTISLGVAAFPQDGITTSALLRAADDAELTAKRLGKNRVYAAQRSENFSDE
jgi:diguanylate cyclase (GGDEF)-like protein